MCQKCQNTSCSGCGGGAGGGDSVASLSAQISELSDTVTALSNLAAPFLKGHPIVILENADDIALFDLTTGKGSDYMALYAVCDGKVHKSIRDNKNITTPNFVDRFLVQAGGTYAVDDTGGAATVALVVSELPVHKHLITDPGHLHAITDPGHDHPVTDPGHVHAASAGTHNHTFTTDTDGTHVHVNEDNYQNDQTNVANDPLGGMTVAASSETQRTVGTNGSAHSHSGTTDNASGAVSVSSAFTGIDVTDAFTGITVDSAVTGITETENEGAGAAHENLPPFYAVLYVMLIG